MQTLLNNEEFNLVIKYATVFIAWKFYLSKCFAKAKSEEFMEDWECWSDFSLEIAIITHEMKCGSKWDHWKEGSLYLWPFGTPPPGNGLKIPWIVQWCSLNLMICEVRRQKWKDNGWRGGALDAPEISGWEWHFKVEGDGKHLAQGRHDREASSKEASSWWRTKIVGS